MAKAEGMAQGAASGAILGARAGESAETLVITPPADIARLEAHCHHSHILGKTHKPVPTPAAQPLRPKSIRPRHRLLCRCLRRQDEYNPGVRWCWRAKAGTGMGRRRSQCSVVKPLLA